MSLDEQNVLIDGEKEIDFRVLLHVFEAAESDFAYLHDPNSPGDGVRPHAPRAAREGVWQSGNGAALSRSNSGSKRGVRERARWVSAEAFEYRKHDRRGSRTSPLILAPSRMLSDLHNTGIDTISCSILHRSRCFQDPGAAKSMALGCYSVPRTPTR